jgi:hypothetical protein
MVTTKTLKRLLPENPCIITAIAPRRCMSRSSSSGGTSKLVKTIFPFTSGHEERSEGSPAYNRVPLYPSEIFLLAKMKFVSPAGFVADKINSANVVEIILIALFARYAPLF